MINHPPGYHRPKAPQWPAWEPKAHTVVAVLHMASDALAERSDQAQLYRRIEAVCRERAERLEGPA